MAMSEIASLYARVGADVTDFMRGMNQVKEETGAFGKTAGLVASGTKLAMGAGVAAIGALAGGIGYATTQAMNMEQAIADITATMGLSAAQTEELKGLITDLGLDPKLKVSATEAAAAIDMLGKNGLTMDQIMGGAAKSAVLLANATNDNFAMAADVATDVMAQFNIGADGMGAAIDQIIGVTQASKFTLDDYALAIAQAGGVAGAVGVGFDDFNAVIAATSSSFASGSDAGTSFKTFLQRLVPQTNEAKTMMMEMGLMTAEGGNAFFDATGKMKPMEEVAGLLQTAFSGLSEQQRIQAASTLFGTDAMRTGLALAEAGTDTIQQYKTTIGNVSAENAAATRMNTLKGAWEVFMGVVETLTLSIGNAFLPQARKLVDWTTAMASKYGPQLVAWAGQFADKLAAVITWLMSSGTSFKSLYDGIMAVVQPIMTIVGHFISWKDVLGAWAILLASVVVPAIWGFLAAAAPVIAIIAGLIAGVALMRKAWETNFGGIRDIVAAIWTYLTDTFGGLISTIKQFGVGALKELSDWVQGNKTNFENMKAIWESVKATASKLWNDLVDYLRGALPQWMATLKEWGAAAWQWIKDTTPLALAKLKEWGQALWEWIKANAPGWAKTLVSWATMAWEWIKDVTPKALTQLAAWGASLWEWIKTNAPGWAAKLWEWAKAAWQWIVDVTPTVLAKLAEWGKALWNWIVDNTPEWVAKLGQWLKAAWQWIVDVTPKAIEKLKEWGTKLWNWIVDNAPTWGAKLAEWTVLAWEWIKKAVPEALRQMGKWAGELYGWLKAHAPEWANNFWQFGVDAFNGLWDGLKHMWDKIKDWTAMALVNWIDFAKRMLGIASPSKVFMGIGRNVLEGMALGLEDGLPAVNTQLNVLGANVTGAGADMMVGGNDTNSLESVLLRLASAIERNGLGNKINVNMQGTGDMRSDLAPTVSYLTALYGTA